MQRKALKRDEQDSGGLVRVHALAAIADEGLNESTSRPRVRRWRNPVRSLRPRRRFRHLQGQFPHPAGKRGSKVTDGKKSGRIGISQESLDKQFFSIVRERFGSLLRTRWSFCQRERRCFSPRAFG